MKNPDGIICVLCLLLTFTGCVETIVMDPREENLPVMVNCLLSPDKDVQTLYLQYVEGRSGKDIAPIKNAKVYVITRIGSRLDTIRFYYTDDNKWESHPTKRIEGGKHYSLSVEIPGKEIIHAETTCPIAFDPYYFSDTHSVYYKIIPNVMDSYKELKTSAVWVYAKGKHKTYESCDEYYRYIVTDHRYADDFNISGYTFKDLELVGDFDGNCMVVSWPAYLNMRRMMPELPLHDEFVRIEHLDTCCFHILAGPLEYPKAGEPHQDHFVFSFVSDEYDEYLRNVYVKQSKLDHDITSIYSTESAYSNIEGGVGVFGSVINRRVPFLRN